MGVHTVPTEEMRTMRVPFSASSVADVRHALQHWMADQGIPGPQIEDARVVVSELVANSIRHARPLPEGDLTVSWCIEDGCLRLSVTDGGAATRPHTVDASPSALSGRGMAIVDTLAQRWWVEDRRTITTVHTQLQF